MAGAPAFVVTFRAEPGVDATRALRALLKAALRRHGLRCVNLVPMPEPSPAAGTGARLPKFGCAHD
jgi:hypothetical protein